MNAAKVPREVDVARYLRAGGALPEGPLAGRVRALLAESAAVIAPRRAFSRVPLARFGWASEALSAHLAGCAEVYLLCGTLGLAFDAFQRRAGARSAADAFVLQAIGAAALEDWLDECEGEIRAELAPGETPCARFSPGYGDFPLAANRGILEALDAPRRLGVTLAASGALLPSKSVTAVVGVRAG